MLLSFMILFNSKSSAQNFKWNKNDTLEYYFHECKDDIRLFFLPNGKFLYYDNGSYDHTREYGNWKLTKDSVIVNIFFVDKAYEKEVDTSFYRCYPLNPDRFPYTGLDGPKNKYFGETFPTDLFFDKLK